jgi:predicted RNase H-like nuclease
MTMLLGHCAVVAIDIPIGLTTGPPRLCDQQARGLLGSPRNSSVFPAPIRPVLAATTHSQASALSKRLIGKGVTLQAWGIYPKVREIDVLLQATPVLMAKTHEVHPELCFRQLNGGTALAHSKKDPRGRQEREQLVNGHFGSGTFAALRAQVPSAVAAADDILDALAALWTAERIYSGTAVTIPDPVPLDPCGLPMKMSF